MIRYDSRSGKEVFYLNASHVVGVKAYYAKDGTELEQADIYTTDSSYPWEVFGKGSQVARQIAIAARLGWDYDDQS